MKYPKDAPERKPIRNLSELQFSLKNSPNKMSVFLIKGAYNFSKYWPNKLSKFRKEGPINWHFFPKYDLNKMSNFPRSGPNRLFFFEMRSE